jgi:hypothetical protein
MFTMPRGMVLQYRMPEKHFKFQRKLCKRIEEEMLSREHYINLDTWYSALRL